MIDLSTVFERLKAQFPEYEFELKKRFGRQFIVVKEDTYRGAEIYAVETKVQVLPMTPTLKGKMLFGSGQQFAKHLIKRYEEAGKKVYDFLAKEDLGVEVELIDTPFAVERDEKGKRNDHYAMIILGLVVLGLAAFLYMQFEQLEQEGGEMKTHAIIALLYENFGKVITTGLLAIAGLALAFTGWRKLQN